MAKHGRNYSKTFNEIVKDAKEEAPSKKEQPNVRLSFEKYEDGSDYCLSECTTDEIQTALKCFQKICLRTWQQILDTGTKERGSKSGLHFEIIPDNAIKGASRPATLSEDVKICSVRASQVFRIYGFRESESFHPLWYDPHHQICNG